MTDLLGTRFDAYTLKARFYPSLIVILPLMLAVVAWVPEAQTLLGGLVSLVATGGGAYLLTELGRDLGKQSENALFGMWGAKPTTLALRHDGNANPVLLQRRHDQMHRVTGITLPTGAQEAANRNRADQTYDAAVAVLRERTRDRARFRLLFEENRSFGFRRNLWGLRTAGIVVALIGLLASGVQTYRIPGPVTLTCVGLCAAALALWTLRVTPEWVRLTGEAYARALLASLDTLDAEAGQRQG